MELQIVGKGWLGLTPFEPSWASVPVGGIVRLALITPKSPPQPFLN